MSASDLNGLQRGCLNMQRDVGRLLRRPTASVLRIKSRRRDDGRQKAFEALAGLGKLGRDARAARMNLGADMVRDAAHDPFAVSGRQPLSRIGEAVGQAVDPQAATRTSFLNLCDRMLDAGIDFEAGIVLRGSSWAPQVERGSNVRT